jgi:hypothetical protein
VTRRDGSPSSGKARTALRKADPTAAARRMTPTAPSWMNMPAYEFSGTFE